MAETNPTQPAAEARRTFRQSAQQAGLFILFATILAIPRIRRLRRRVVPWTSIRLAAAGCGGWLIWRFIHTRTSTPLLIFGIALLLFALLVHSSPVGKSVDALAREFNALVALNGGAFRSAPDSLSVHPAQIFVHPERLIVVGSREQRLAEIPLSSVRNLTVRPVPDTTSNGNAPWEVGIHWMAGEPHTAIFRYEGAFAEHLARVTESTVRSQWKKELPVIPN
jgi:hypothetical protein